MNTPRLIFTDTDSLEYHIPIENLDDFNQRMLSISDDWLDTSNYPEEHPFYSKRNKKLVGFIKNESPIPILEAVAIRSKVHAERTALGSDVKLKGINKAVVKKTISPEMLVRCVTQSQCLQVDQTNFRCKTQRISTVKQTKLALSPFDDKRYILEDGISTRAYVL